MELGETLTWFFFPDILAILFSKQTQTAERDTRPYYHCKQWERLRLDDLVSPVPAALPTQTLKDGLQAPPQQKKKRKRKEKRRRVSLTAAAQALLTSLPSGPWWQQAKPACYFYPASRSCEAPSPLEMQRDLTLRVQPIRKCAAVSVFLAQCGTSDVLWKDGGIFPWGTFSSKHDCRSSLKLAAAAGSTSGEMDSPYWPILVSPHGKPYWTQCCMIQQTTVCILSSALLPL